MTDLIEDYLHEVDSTLRVDAARKRQIVDELRTHLLEKVQDVQAADPARPRFDVEQEVLREFGNPRDLALAYESDGTAVLRSAAGDIVARAGKSVGRGAAAVARGTGAFLKWTAIALAILLVTALGVGAWAYYEVKPYIPGMIESTGPVYEYFERCGETPCNGAPAADSFYVRPEAKTVRFDIDVTSIHPAGSADRSEHVGNGTLRVQVLDPSGLTRYDRTFGLGDEASVRHETSWAAEAGNWSVSYEFTDFVGAVDVETYAVSLPFEAGR